MASGETRLETRLPAGFIDAIATVVPQVIDTHFIQYTWPGQDPSKVIVSESSKLQKVGMQAIAGMACRFNGGICGAAACVLAFGLFVVLAPSGMRG